MKDVIQFKPKEVLDVKTFKILAFACKLFFIEKWSFEQAVTMACNYYDEDNVDHIDDLFYRFAKRPFPWSRFITESRKKTSGNT